MVVSLPHTTAVSTGGAAHGNVTDSHHVIALVPQPFSIDDAVPYLKSFNVFLSIDFTNYSL
jgi:hypothetical protein